ncbi:hypothetical protein FKM82_014424 [Ascaphus truei]
MVKVAPYSVVLHRHPRHVPCFRRRGSTHWTVNTHLVSHHVSASDLSSHTYPTTPVPKAALSSPPPPIYSSCTVHFSTFPGIFLSLSRVYRYTANIQRFILILTPLATRRCLQRIAKRCMTMQCIWCQTGLHSWPPLLPHVHSLTLSLLEWS